MFGAWHMETEIKKRKILIVDDDSFLLDMYALKFSQNGFEVYGVSGGKEALDKLRGGLTPDVILMDITMPDMDGFEMLTKMNSENLCKDCVKIVLSNKNQQADIDESKRLNVAGYIVKANFTPSEVIKKVEEVLDKKSAAGK